MVRSAGRFLDFDGCQIAGHFSMFNSDRILSAMRVRGDSLLPCFTSTCLGSCGAMFEFWIGFTIVDSLIIYKHTLPLACVGI